VNITHPSTSPHLAGKTQTILDATGGPAVSCLGYGNERVKAAVAKQQDEISYAHSMFFGTRAGEELGEELIRGTGGEMGRCFIVSSGMFLHFFLSHLYFTRFTSCLAREALKRRGNKKRK